MKRTIIITALLFFSLSGFSPAKVDRDTTFMREGRIVRANIYDDNTFRFTSVDKHIVTDEENERAISCIEKQLLKCRQDAVCLCQCFACDINGTVSLGCAITFGAACLFNLWREQKPTP